MAWPLRSSLPARQTLSCAPGVESGRGRNPKPITVFSASGTHRSAGYEPIRGERCVPGARARPPARHTRHPGIIEHAPADQLWSRAAIERETRDATDLPPAMQGIEFVLVGHTPGPVPRCIRHNALCIDTGVHIEDYEYLTIAESQTGEPRLHRFAR